MTTPEELGPKLHGWLADTLNRPNWYTHVVFNDFKCGCVRPATYCQAWRDTVSPPSTTKMRSFWVHTNDTPVSDAMIAVEAPRRSYVVLNAWNHRLIPKFKAANPHIKVFVYKCMSSTRAYDNNTVWWQLPAGVSYAYANTHRPDWFLKKNGARVQWSYGGHWQMDIGLPEYQSMWVNNVKDVKQFGFDGVWVDNLLWKRSAYSIYPDKYTTDVQLRDVYRSALRYITPGLKAAGLLVIGNLNGAREVSGGWNSYIDAGLDGGFDEFWLSVNNNGLDLLPEYSEGWRRQVAEITDTEQRGKIALMQPHFPTGNTRVLLYCLASFYMGYAGKAAFVDTNGTDEYGDPMPWRPEYDWDLGAPTGPYQWAASNVFKRYFTKGMVVANANPTGTANVTIQLGGAYKNEDGVVVTSVTLPGTSGSILRKV